MFDKETVKALIKKAIALAGKYAESTESKKDDLLVEAIAFLFTTLSPVFGDEGEPSGGEDLPIGLRSEITAEVIAAQD